MLYYNLLNNRRDNQCANDFFNLKDNEKEAIGRSVPTNIISLEKETVLELAVPGYAKEQISIQLEKDHLIVEGLVQEEKREEKEEKKVKYQRIGFKQQAFVKRFKIAQSMDLENASASFNNGILSISIPEKEEQKVLKKQIAIS